MQSSCCITVLLPHTQLGLQVCWVGGYGCGCGCGFGCLLLGEMQTHIAEKRTQTHTHTYTCVLNNCMRCMINHKYSTHVNTHTGALKDYMRRVFDPHDKLDEITIIFTWNFYALLSGGSTQVCEPFVYLCVCVCVIGSVHHKIMTHCGSSAVCVCVCVCVISSVHNKIMTHCGSSAVCVCVCVCVCVRKRAFFSL